MGDSIAVWTSQSFLPRRPFDYAGAIAEGEQILAERRRVLGDDHEDTFSLRLSLATWRGEGFDVAAAVAELEPLVEEVREKLGDDHRRSTLDKAIQGGHSTDMAKMNTSAMRAVGAKGNVVVDVTLIGRNLCDDEASTVVSRILGRIPS